MLSENGHREGFPGAVSDLCHGLVLSHKEQISTKKKSQKKTKRLGNKVERKATRDKIIATY